MKKILPLTIISFVLIQSAIFADVIHLKSGGKVEGIIEKETDEAVTLAISIGSMTYSKDKIASISRASDEENAKLKEEWRAQKQHRQAEQEQWRKFAAPKTEEKKKVKVVVEPAATLPPSDKKSSLKGAQYENLLGETTLKALKNQPDQTYYLYLPKQYSPSKKWPLFIGIHAYSSDGKQAMDFWRRFADEEGFVLVCPNFRDGYQRLEYATDSRMIDIIEELKKDFRIYEKKVLMAGFSGGAQFAHRFVLRHPEYIQAVSVMAAGSYNKPSFSQKGKDIKFLVMVGTDDRDRFKLTEKFAKQLKDEGYEVKFKAFSEVGHWVCDEEMKLTIQLFRELINTKQ